MSRDNKWNVFKVIWVLVFEFAAWARINDWVLNGWVWLNLFLFLVLGLMAIAWYSLDKEQDE